MDDPRLDLTDLFAFTSPENPSRTVLAANVFPTCGADAIFSNASGLIAGEALVAVFASIYLAATS